MGFVFLDFIVSLPFSLLWTPLIPVVVFCCRVEKNLAAMDDFKECTRFSSTTADKLARRLSPRLHNTAILCSPRLDKHISPKFRDSSSQLEPAPEPQPDARESLNDDSASASCEIITASSPNIVSNFRRRLSPRLHKDLANENSSISLGTTPMQPRFSPRLHKIVVESLDRRVSLRLHSHGQNPKRKLQEESIPQSPRLHSDGQNQKRRPKESKCTPQSQRRASPRVGREKRKPKESKSTPQRKVSPRLHSSNSKNSFSNNPKKLKPSHLNGEAAANDVPVPVPEPEPEPEPEPPSEVSNVLEKKAGTAIHARVKKTLRIFNTYYLQFVQEEEERRKKIRIDKEKNSKAVKSKDKDVKQTSSRPDLKAISKMKEKEEILYPDKRIGHIPGIEVGYQFFSRAEMVAIGFHSHWLNGIDYIGQSAGKMGKHGHYTFPIAISVVMSGQYEDDLDNADDIIYTGQGGHDLVGSKLQCADQVLLRGNLAMKNNMEQSVPVRVVRGHRSAKSYSGKIYTYDGLYKVVETWADKGQRGHLVYKYHLKRIEGQPKLTTNQVQFVQRCPSKTFSELPGLVCRDISNGQEAICIPVTNLFDDAYVDEGFTYIKTIEVAESVNLPPSTAGCACKGNCTNPKTCACAKLNGSDFPYVRRDGGRLVEAKDVVFECGPNCSCGPGCLNRTSQRGIKYHLEVYRTPDKGWAVRSWDFIPSGAPVCEYIGLLRRSDELDNLSGNDYIFEIDCWHTINEIGGRERRFGNVPVSATSVLSRIDDKTLDSAPEFCLDAGSRGNVARFINHSCEPNLFVQCILSAHRDLRLARVVLFAAENIPPLQELTYDYAYALDSVTGADGKVKALPCFCGTLDCRKRLY